MKTLSTTLKDKGLGNEFNFSSMNRNRHFLVLVRKCKNFQNFRKLQYSSNLTHESMFYIIKHNSKHTYTLLNITTMLFLELYGLNIFHTLLLCVSHIESGFRTATLTPLSVTWQFIRS